jgi:hypothetical protein
VGSQPSVFRVWVLTPPDSDRIAGLTRLPYFRRGTRPFLFMSEMATDERLGFPIGRRGRSQAQFTAVIQPPGIIC